MTRHHVTIRKISDWNRTWYWQCQCGQMGFNCVWRDTCDAAARHQKRMGS